VTFSPFCGYALGKTIVNLFGLWRFSIFRRVFLGMRLPCREWSAEFDVESQRADEGQQWTEKQEENIRLKSASVFVKFTGTFPQTGKLIGSQ
jgi:hypothetical protein